MKMSRLSRNKRLIHSLTLLPKRQRNKLLRKVDKSCIDSLRDCCGYILQGHVPLNLTNKRKLKPYKSKLRAAANPKIGSTKARKHFQFGGFFQALIPVLASILGPIISTLARE